MLAKNEDLSGIEAARNALRTQSNAAQLEYSKRKREEQIVNNFGFKRQYKEVFKSVNSEASLLGFKSLLRPLPLCDLE